MKVDCDMKNCGLISTDIFPIPIENNSFCCRHFPSIYGSCRTVSYFSRIFFGNSELKSFGILKRLLTVFIQNNGSYK